MTQSRQNMPWGSLSADQLTTLRIIAGHMIPQDADLALPGADDEVIFNDLASSLERDTEKVRQALSTLCVTQDYFLKSSQAAQLLMLASFKSAHPALAAVLETVVAQCYYRDDRVMRAIGMEPRPPFPSGFELKSGDFTLLDPVKARGKAYRDAS